MFFAMSFAPGIVPGMLYCRGCLASCPSRLALDKYYCFLVETLGVVTAAVSMSRGVQVGDHELGLPPPFLGLRVMASSSIPSFWPAQTLL